MTTPRAYLLSLELIGIKFGLRNIAALVEALDHPERAFRSVHVAGTNGKGSVTAMVACALQAAGYVTGRYTSPHLVDLTERFAVDGVPVDEAGFADAVERVRQAVDRLRRRGALETEPTFFEVTTAVGFDIFRSRGVEVAVCEVGLGGRLDATNVLSPEVTAIASIGLDHQQYLGSTLAAVAREKAGVVKPGVPVVVGRMSEEARGEIEARARAVGAPIVSAVEGCDVVRVTEPAGPVPAGRGTTFRLRTPVRDYGEITLALAGAHQIDNALVAIRLLEELDARGTAVPAAAIVRGLATVRWPGRMDLRRLPDGREALLDAAHNPDGAAALAAALEAEGVKYPLVFAAMRDKDAGAMLRRLAPQVSAIVITRASNPRAADPDALGAVARAVAPDVPVLIEPSPSAAMAAAWRLSPRITVGGSIFLLGDVMEEFPTA